MVRMGCSFVPFGMERIGSRLLLDTHIPSSAAGQIPCIENSKIAGSKAAVVSV
jgi:hypothetical protein